MYYAYTISVAFFLLADIFIIFGIIIGYLVVHAKCLFLHIDYYLIFKLI